MRAAPHLVTAILAVVNVAVLAVPAQATPDYQQVIDATFPADPRVTFSDTYDACRSGCERIHKATDLMGERMYALYAMVDGEICSIDDGAEDSYGRHLTLCGDDGRRYRYLHLNNDTPGTDDGAAALEHVYAPGIRAGGRVARGQHVAYMGDSGNAEATGPHLHLDIFDDRVTDPYGDNRINPYPTLVAALDRGDIPDGSAYHADPARRVAGEDRIGTAIALAASRFDAADVALLAPWDSPGEAIVAGPLAAELDAPVYVTRRDALDPRVADELARLGVTQIYLVGDLLPGLDLGLGPVTRLDGGDLFATAAAVAEEVWELRGAGDPLEHTVEGEPAAPRHLDPVPPALHVSLHADRSDPHVLDGATIVDAPRISLFPGDLGAIDQVAFHLDDPGATGEPYRIERRAPYDLEGATSDGAFGFDTTVWQDGSHTVTAAITADGERSLVVASVTVANARPPADGLAAEPVDLPELAPRLEVSASADRAGSVLLDRARVRDQVHIHVTGPTDRDTDEVAFWLDDPDREGGATHVESSAPWDLGGSTPTGAVALDTATLDNGTHTVTAMVQRSDGDVETVTATFEVRNVVARHALVALGAHEDPTRSWPDSLMASYYGAALRRPVLLVGPDRVPDATAAALTDVVDVKIVGGPAAVPDDLYATVEGHVHSISRVAGADRYATAAAVTRDLLDRDLVDVGEVWAATGRNWPDAATAGPIVFGHGRALVLVDGDAQAADAATRDFLQRAARRTARGWIIGGPAAVSSRAVRTFRLRIT